MPTLAAMRHHQRQGDSWIDTNGNLRERTTIGGQEVIVTYDDIPESDVTTIDGLRVTTPVRTLIDLASEVDAHELDRMLQHAFDHGLCTREEIVSRCSEPDLRSRPGARLLLRLLH